MRAILLLLLLTGSVLAGCLNGPSGTDTSREDATPTLPPLLAEEIHTPSGAELLPIPHGFALHWANATLPFEQDIITPPGATMIRFTADPGQDRTVSVAMSHTDTGRRRCNQQSVLSLSETLTGPRSCSSVALLDNPGAPWTIRATGNGRIDATVEFLDAPLDGIAGHLRLDRLSKLTHELQPTQFLTVPSFDGTPLWVEVTLPEGEGPWPTILASSPYSNDADPTDTENPFNGRTTPAMWSYFVQDWAKRGYAVVMADVRGYGESGGCVEVWGYKEQRDQLHLVEWVEGQDWSDGNVGFYGQSYVGTTPVAAASYAPSALKAIITVAPVINAYNDWHYGGVPNGENLLSPVAYQALTGIPAVIRPDDPLTTVVNHANGVCDATLSARANDPRAVYDQFYIERDFRRTAGDITAAVLYTQGFEDANVKSAMIPGWFNNIASPKLGLFGHWLHQHPPRMDEEVLFVGWMDQYVKGIDLGFEKAPAVQVVVDHENVRNSESWPSRDAEELVLWPDFDKGGFANGPVTGDALLTLDPIGANTPTENRISLRTELRNPLAITGVPELDLQGVFLSAGNAYVASELWEERADGSYRLLTWGQFNLAHRYGHDKYEPLAPGERAWGDLPFRPTEHIVPEGSTLRLDIRAVRAVEALPPVGGNPGAFDLSGGPGGVRLVLPTMPMEAYQSAPLTALP